MNWQEHPRAMLRVEAVSNALERRGDDLDPIDDHAFTPGDWGDPSACGYIREDGPCLWPEQDHES